MFSAVREGNFEIIRILVEEAKAVIDLASSEMVKDESPAGEDDE